MGLESQFNENIDKGFQLEIYVSDSESESGSEKDSDSESDEGKSEKDSYDDCIAKITKIPIQMLFIEKLEGTLEDLLKSIEQVDVKLILSCIHFPIYSLSFCL